MALGFLSLLVNKITFALCTIYSGVSWCRSFLLKSLDVVVSSGVSWHHTGSKSEHGPMEREIHTNGKTLKEKN